MSNQNKKKILIVDDELDFVDIVDLALTQAGFDVMVAQNGVDAIVVAEKIKFDVIVTDMNMPRMNGMALATCLRTGKANVATPIVIFSAQNFEDQLAKARELGIARFIQKPFEMHILVDLLKVLGGNGEEYDQFSVSFGDIIVASTMEVLRFYFSDHKIEYKRVQNGLVEANTICSGIINISDPTFNGFLTFSLGDGLVTKFAEVIFQDKSIHMDESLITHITGELASQVGTSLRSKIAGSTSISSSTTISSETPVGAAIQLGTTIMVYGPMHKITQKSKKPMSTVQFSIDDVDCYVGFSAQNIKV